MQKPPQIDTVFNKQILQFSIEEKPTPINKKSWLRQELVERATEVQLLDINSQFGYFNNCSMQFIYACENFISNKN